MGQTEAPLCSAVSSPHRPNGYGNCSPAVSATARQRPRLIGYSTSDAEQPRDGIMTSHHRNGVTSQLRDCTLTGALITVLQVTQINAYFLKGDAETRYNRREFSHERGSRRLRQVSNFYSRISGRSDLDGHLSTCIMTHRGKGPPDEILTRVGIVPGTVERH